MCIADDGQLRGVSLSPALRRSEHYKSMIDFPYKNGIRSQESCAELRLLITIMLTSLTMEKPLRSQQLALRPVTSTDVVYESIFA
jgi:hypothetical protein